MKNEFLTSWGRIQRPVTPVIHGDIREAFACERTVLAYGMGRSYGDVCLNGEGSVYRTRDLNGWLESDWENGIIRVQSGVTLEEILLECVPHGWFLKVVPGTRFVSVGGAIANDVHGKNHHIEGTFGHHVLRIGLRRSDEDELLECSSDSEQNLFYATIGGMGLTGIIEWAEIALQPISSSTMDVEFTPFQTLEEFEEINFRSSSEWPYTVAWVDLMRADHERLPGIFMKGKHSEEGDELKPARSGSLITLKKDLFFNPFFRPVSRTFNLVYSLRQQMRRGQFKQHYSPFFHPLDAVGGWNHLYGKKGFFQYQCVIPKDSGLEPVRALLQILSDHKTVVPLAVFKQTGDMPSAGLMSFPLPGWTLAFDFPNRGNESIHLMSEMDGVVERAGGRLYSAKDNAMEAAFFQKSYPQWERLEALRDSKINSDFWRRLTRLI